MARNNKWNGKEKASGKNGFCKNSKPMTKNNSSKKARRAKEVVDTVEKSEENDYSWHSKFASFSQDAGNIQFATPLGNSLSINGDKVYTPGVMALRFAPTIGYSADQRSPINRSADRFKTYLRSVQKASADYDAADIMIIEMAIDSLLVLHRHLIRAYKTANLYSATNKYYPDALLVAMGFDLSVKNQMSEFRGFINQLGINLTRFVMPANFDINQRHKWMVEGLYLDGNTNKAQTYLFVPAGFWKYNSTASTGGQLTWVSAPASGQGWTLSQWIQTATQLLNALSNDDDVNTINGDMYAAYGQSGIAPIPSVGDLDLILPAYDPVVLSQIENATIVGGWAPGYVPLISQDTAVNGKGLLFTPTFMGNSSMRIYPSPTSAADAGICANAAIANSGAVMNMHIPSPSPEAIMEASRLIVAVETPLPKPNAVSGEFSPTIFGSDVVFSLAISYFATGSGALQVYEITTQTIPLTQNIPAGVTQNRISDVWAMTESFDWCPMFYNTVLDATSGNVNIQQIMADIDNITWVPSWQINMLHEASLLSLFEVPEFDGRLARAGER